LDQSDRDLIEKCRAGDSEAWKTLVEKYSRRIFNIVYQFTSSVEDSEDLTQEIFIKVFRSLNNFDTETAFIPWLIRVSKNYCIDNYRLRRRSKIAKDSEQALTMHKDYTYHPFKSLLEKERASFLMKGIQALSVDLRTIVVLRDIQGFNYSEIAEALGIPEGTVKSRINRARIELAQILKKMKGFKTIL